MRKIVLGSGATKENAAALAGKKRACRICRHRVDCLSFGFGCDAAAVPFVDPVTGDSGVKRIVRCRIARHTPLCRFEPADLAEDRSDEKGES